MQDNVIADIYNQGLQRSDVKLFTFFTFLRRKRIDIMEFFGRIKPKNFRVIEEGVLNNDATLLPIASLFDWWEQPEGHGFWCDISSEWEAFKGINSLVFDIEKIPYASDYPEDIEYLEKILLAVKHNGDMNQVLTFKTERELNILENNTFSEFNEKYI
jgi:hypothetical protein